MEEQTFEGTVDQLSVLEWVRMNNGNTELLREVRLAIQAEERKHKPARKIVTQYSEASMEVAKELAASVQANYPFTPEPNLEQWADDIDKLVRIDKYDPLVVRGAMQFSQYDTFWRQQVRSGANLRKHFVQICVKAKEYQQNHGQTVKV